MTSGPELSLPGENWAVVESHQDQAYAERLSRSAAGGVLGRTPAGVTARPTIDTTKPHSARRYNYWLGGKDNFAVDRASGDMIAAAYPAVRIAAIENRRFLQRAVRFLAAECGIRQFLDIGTGLPTADNTHQIAQAIAPEARVVYVDNDPLVMAHARALLTSTPEGRTDYIQADLRHPGRILADPTLRSAVDLDQPVGLLLVAILHFIADDDDPGMLLHHLIQALPAGSYLVLSHATFDPLPRATIEALTQLSGTDVDHGAFHPRSRCQVDALLHGLALIEPGLVPVSEWRPDKRTHFSATFDQTAVYAAVASVP